MANKFWRDASSLILVFRNSAKIPINSKFDYSLLMLKRSNKSKFMPNAYVFPGGVTDKHDQDNAWTDILNGCLDSSRKNSDLILKDVPRPLLVQNKSEPESLEKDLAFRICAIRETFEEAGILLHKVLDPSGTNKFDTNSLAEWREKVRRDASEFYNMCKILNICPDIWSL